MKFKKYEDIVVEETHEMYTNSYLHVYLVGLLYIIR